MKFKRNKVKVKTPLSKRGKKLKWILVGILSLVLLNFSWDGYKRQDDLQKTYELGKQYYGIIVDETGNFANTLKKRIDTTEKGK